MKKKLSFIICVIIFHNYGISQNVVKGNIHSETFQGIPGVAVHLKGTSRLAVTDQNGNFSIRLPQNMRNDTSRSKLVLTTKNAGFSETDLHLNNAKFISQTVRSGTIEMSHKFPWPPPDYSASSVLDNEIFKNCDDLHNADFILSKALKNVGYTEKGYYSVPGGFAVITRIEQIDKNGVSLDPPERWSVNTFSPLSFSITSYLKALFFSTPGYFRIIAFIVTDKPFNSSDKLPDENSAIDWIKNGTMVLPAEIGALKFTKDHTVTALIYEFQKPESDDVFLINPSDLTGDDHLKLSKILPELNKN
jgi:hypothetical protein